MQRGNRWLVGVVVIAGLQLSACSQKPETASQSKPAKVERLQGTNVSRVTLSARAAERLDIRTAPVGHEQVAGRKRTVGGEVVALPQAEADARNRAWVRVPLPRDDLRRVARGYPARVLPLDRDDDNGEAGVMAQAVDGQDNKEPSALIYAIESAGPGLAPGQRVRIELPWSAGGMKRTVVPHAAVLYDPQGNTWVYTSPEPLVFVRHRISIDYIEGDLAVLLEGPPADTAVVTVGAAELFGTEFGIGK